MGTKPWTCGTIHVNNTSVTYCFHCCRYTPECLKVDFPDVARVKLNEPSERRNRKPGGLQLLCIKLQVANKCVVRPTDWLPSVSEENEIHDRKSHDAWCMMLVTTCTLASKVSYIYNAFRMRIGMSLCLYLSLSASVLCERETNRMAVLFLFVTSYTYLVFYATKTVT